MSSSRVDHEMMLSELISHWPSYSERSQLTIEKESSPSLRTSTSQSACPFR